VENAGSGPWLRRLLLLREGMTLTRRTELARRRIWRTSSPGRGRESDAAAGGLRPSRSRSDRLPSSPVRYRYRVFLHTLHIAGVHSANAGEGCQMPVGARAG